MSNPLEWLRLEAWMLTKRFGERIGSYLMSHFDTKAIFIRGFFRLKRFFFIFRLKLEKSVQALQWCEKWVHLIILISMSIGNHWIMKCNCALNRRLYSKIFLLTYSFENSKKILVFFSYLAVFLIGFGFAHLDINSTRRPPLSRRTIFTSVLKVSIWWCTCSSFL